MNCESNQQVSAASGLNSNSFGSSKTKCESKQQISAANGLDSNSSGTSKTKCESKQPANGLNNRAVDNLKKPGFVASEQTASAPAKNGLSNYCFGSLKTQREFIPNKQQTSVNGLNTHGIDSSKKSDRLTVSGLNNPRSSDFKVNSLKQDISSGCLTTEDTSNKPISLQIASVRLAQTDTKGYHKSCVNVNVKDTSQKSTTASSSEDISADSVRLSKVVVNLKPESSSVSKSHNGPILIKSNICRDSNSSPSASEKSSNQFSNSTEDTHSNFYPLQKSSGRLNFEPKDVEEDHIETFLPPPTEFRSVDTNESPLPQSHPNPSKSLRRSSSLLNLANLPPPAKSNRVRHLQRSLSDLSIDDKGEFEAEQQRLQREYAKLQRQFVLWQQQLMSNHAMLSEECLVPQYARTLRQSHSLPEGEDYSDESSAPCPLVSRSLSYEPTKDRSSTLPRSTINIPSLVEFGSTTTINNGSSTLRSSKTKSYFKPPQVRISTKNRQRLPPEIRKDGDLDIYDDSKILSTILPTFDSLKLISENEDGDSTISKLRNNQPLTKLESLRNNRNQKDATVLKKNEQATKLENLLNGDDSGTTVLHLKNGHNVQNSIDVVSKTNGQKSTSFVSNTNGQNSISFVSNTNGQKSIGVVSNTNGQKSIGIVSNSANMLKKNEDSKKIPPPVPNKTSSLPKHIFGQNIGNGHCPNGDTGQVRLTAKVNGHTVPSDPPPLPVNGLVNGKSNIKAVSGPQRKMAEKQIDPREELMQAIRKCGGRTALRKVKDKVYKFIF